MQLNKKSQLFLQVEAQSFVEPSFVKGHHALSLEYQKGYIQQICISNEMRRRANYSIHLAVHLLMEI